MTTMSRFSFVVILGAGLSAVPAGAQKKDPLPAERVKLVRQMYKKVPPLIFEVVEPVTVVKATLWEDGGSISVELKDAKGKEFSMFLNRRIGSPTRETMYVSYIPYSSTQVLLRGPEEAALYGILLRWKATKDAPDWTPESVGAMLDHLDQRFAVVAEARNNGAKNDADRLQGKWRFVSYYSARVEVPKEDLQKMTMIIKDGAMIISDETKKETYSFTVDPKKTPREIDVREGNKEPLLGIYELKDDTLRLAISDERPKEFPRTLVAGQTLMVLQREKN